MAGIFDVANIGVIFQVALIDLLLGGDNAVVIALACRSLPPRQMRQAMLVGTFGAVAMRILLAVVLGMLLTLPGLKLAGSAALLVIAVKLIIDEEKDEDGGGKQATGFWAAVGLILTADLVMSLDNVVALSAVAKGNVGVLVFGLLLSIPLVMFGSKLVGALLHRFPILIQAGGALLGWIAGEIGPDDSLIKDWVETLPEFLHLATSLAGAALVLASARLIKLRRAAA